LETVRVSGALSPDSLPAAFSAATENVIVLWVMGILRLVLLVLPTKVCHDTASRPTRYCATSLLGEAFQVSSAYSLPRELYVEPASPDGGSGGSDRLSMVNVLKSLAGV
jgi:hypothetical protein